MADFFILKTALGWEYRILASMFKALQLSPRSENNKQTTFISEESEHCQEDQRMRELKKKNPSAYPVKSMVRAIISPITPINT